jgi:hypothetical protein
LAQRAIGEEARPVSVFCRGLGWPIQRRLGPLIKALKIVRFCGRRLPAAKSMAA